MSESEFAAMLLAWAKKFCTTYNDGEYLPYENQADEDKDHAEHGSDHVVFAYAGSALQGLVDQGTHKIIKDLSKVKFDWENWACDPSPDDATGFWTTEQGVPVLCFMVGGDWEDPMYFVLYPESTTSVRAYIPKEGNTWHLKAKTAWGSQDNVDGFEDEDMDPELNPRKPNVAELKADVSARLM